MLFKKGIMQNTVYSYLFLFVFVTHHKCEGLRRHGSILRETIPDTHLNMRLLYTITCGISQTTYNPEEREKK